MVNKEKLVLLRGMATVTPPEEYSFNRWMHYAGTNLYRLAKNGHVTLKVFEALGKEAATLVDEIKHACIYHSTFTADILKLFSGIYSYHLSTEAAAQSKKMILLK